MITITTRSLQLTNRENLFLYYDARLPAEVQLIYRENLFLYYDDVRLPGWEEIEHNQRCTVVGLGPQLHSEPGVYLAFEFWHLENACIPSSLPWPPIRNTPGFAHADSRGLDLHTS